MKLLFVVLASYFIFSHLASYQFQYNRNNALKKNSLNEFPKIFHVMCTGEKHLLKYKLKKSIKTLGLGHILTPSGLHFSAIFTFIRLLLGFLPTTLRRYKNFLEIPILIFPFFFDELFSMKRISILIFLIKFFKSTKVNVDIFILFLITFLFDFIFGSYSQSPFSFAYSFMFLGLILSSPKKELQLFFILLIGHLIASSIFYQKIYPLGLFLGFLFTIVFSISFPLIAIFWLFNFNLFGFVESTGILIESSLIKLSSLITEYTFSLRGSMSCIFLILIIYLIKNQSRKYLILITTILHSPLALNSDESIYRQSKKISASKVIPISEKIKKTKRTRKGFKVETIKNRKCYYKLVQFTYTRKCRI